MSLKRIRFSMLTLASAVTFLARPMPGYSQEKSAFKNPAAARVITETITLGTGDAKFSCYVARPAGDKPAPGLVLIHEWWGLNDWVKKQSDRYAAMGYVVIAPDLYHGEVAKDAEHAHELMRGLADERAVADMKAAFEYLSKHKQVSGKPIGAMGWCMGGGLALKLAIAEPRVACTVVCYGKPVTDVDQLKKIKGPLLGIWGATDRGIEVEPFKKTLDKAGAKHTHHIYPGAGHAFLNESNKRGYNKEQAEKAWKEIDDFLMGTLKKNDKGTSDDFNTKARTMLDIPWDKSSDIRIKRKTAKGLSGVERVVHVSDHVMSTSYPKDDKDSTLKACMKGLTRGQRIAMVISEVEMEVNNGGFNQYYSNSSGHFALEAVDAFREIGLPHFAEIVNQANSYFPDGQPPRNRASRNKLLGDISDAKWDKVDKKFFDSYKVEEEIARAFDRYIEAHPEEFFVD